MKCYNDLAYVEMCKKATEIQKNWKPSYGDMVSTPKHEDARFIIEVDINCLYFPDEIGSTCKEICTFLPSQSQLQEMVKSDCSCGIQWLHQSTNIRDFSNYLIEIEGDREYRNYKEGKGQGSFANSWDQFWLCLIMFRNYKKSWDGFDFVKKGER